MAFADRVKNWVPFLRGPLRLPPEVIRGLHPTRSSDVTWQREGGDNLVVIHAPRSPDRAWIGLIARLAGEPAGRRVELSDEIASFVWELCDGQRSVSEICRLVAREYKLGERQTEVSVLQFLNMLRSRKLIGLPDPDQAAVNRAAAPKKSGKETRLQSAGTKETGKASDGNSHDRAKRAKTRRARRY